MSDSPGLFGRLLTLVLLACASIDAWAAEIRVPAEPGALAQALLQVRDGDVLRLLPGRHQGPIRIDRPLSLDGGGRAHIEGTGQGSVVTVAAPGVSVSGLTISGSGSSADDRDAGVMLLKQATGARVTKNRLLGNLIGVDIHGARDASVTANVIEGRRDHRMNSRGNGVYVWNAPGSKVIGNDIRWGRDGIFVNTSKRNEFRGNRFRDLRFAVHYMYAHDSVVADNVSIGNHLGFAVMFSKNVTVAGNLSSGDRDYGIMLNYANDSRVTGNRIEGVGDRCVFIYNAHKNRLEGNRFEGCGIGVHFTAGSERNSITGNAFVGNRTQVKYVGTRWICNRVTAAPSSPARWARPAASGGAGRPRRRATGRERRSATSGSTGPPAIPATAALTAGSTARGPCCRSAGKRNRRCRRRPGQMPHGRTGNFPGPPRSSPASA